MRKYFLFSQGRNKLFGNFGYRIFVQRGARWVLYGFMGGKMVENTNIAPILGKWIRLEGTTLRPRSYEYKSNLVKQFSGNLCVLLFFVCVIFA